MAYFLNIPIINNSFTELANYKYFVDKTEMIEKLNDSIDSPDKYICITMPRRFGKTINAMMLACYYSKKSDYKNLFDKTNISKSESYVKYLNKYNVIYMTLNELPSLDCNYKEFIGRYIKLLLEDLKESFSNIIKKIGVTKSVVK